MNPNNQQPNKTRYNNSSLIVAMKVLFETILAV